MLLHLWYILIFKLGYKFSVVELHREFVAGELSQTGLAEFLRPSQLDDFFVYHSMVRRILEIAHAAKSDADLTFYQNQLRSILEGYGQSKKMEKMYSSALIMSAWLSTNPALLNRTQVGMNQLNSLVDGGFLERNVLQVHGGGNVVRGE